MPTIDKAAILEQLQEYRRKGPFDITSLYNQKRGFTPAPLGRGIRRRMLRDWDITGLVIETWTTVSGKDVYLVDITTLDLFVSYKVILGTNGKIVSFDITDYNELSKVPPVSIPANPFKKGGPMSSPTGRPTTISPAGIRRRQSGGRVRFELGANRFICSCLFAGEIWCSHLSEFFARHEELAQITKTAPDTLQTYNLQWDEGALLVSTSVKLLQRNDRTLFLMVDSHRPPNQVLVNYPAEGLMDGLATLMSYYLCHEMADVIEQYVVQRGKLPCENKRHRNLVPPLDATTKKLIANIYTFANWRMCLNCHNRKTIGVESDVPDL